MEFHEVASMFPLMQGQEFDDLCKDIAANGLHEAIWTYDDKIIDGRNRYRACETVGIIPEYRTWQGDEGALLSFVLSLNLHRRHLTASQRAAVAVDVEAYLAIEAKKRMAVRGLPFQLIEKVKEPLHAAAQAAEMLQTNTQYVVDAKKIKEYDPALFSKVQSGEMTIPQAKREVVRSERANTPALPTDKYRVIYADPPWQYGNTQPDYHVTQDDHYATMSLSDICALPVIDIVEDNAVLFIWATSPILEEVFQVIKAWGFKYKASFVWDKIKHNMGHYNSVRHEMLLICVRGSCQPDTPKLYDSVISEERTEHSKKPETFRQIIDVLYPRGKRIELFARRKIDGWDIYGNEPGIS